MSGLFAKRRFVFVIGSAACCLISACNPNGPYVPIPDTGASLKGTVTYKKQPLTAGVVFVSGTDSGGNALIGPDGTYTILNVPVGEVTVGVDTEKIRSILMSQAMSQAMSKSHEGGKNAKGAPAPAPAPKIVDVPKRYAHPTTSPIKTVLRSGENTFDIVID